MSADHLPGADPAIELELRYCAGNYSPLPVVLVRAAGAHAWDRNGRRYLDMMSAYSAVSHGHAHPRLIRALTQQAQQLSVVSRAFHSDRLGAVSGARMRAIQHGMRAAHE